MKTLEELLELARRGEDRAYEDLTRALLRKGHGPTFAQALELLTRPPSHVIIEIQTGEPTPSYRVETLRAFKEHTAKWLKEGGALILDGRIKARVVWPETVEIKELHAEDISDLESDEH